MPEVAVEVCLTLSLRSAPRGSELVHQSLRHSEKTSTSTHIFVAMLALPCGYARAQSCPAQSLPSTLASASAALAGEGVHVPARVPPSSSARARVGGSRGLDSDF